MSDELEREIRRLGFESKAEFNKLVASIDLSSPLKFAAFNRWKESDGSKEGLVTIIHTDYDGPSHLRPKNTSLIFGAILRSFQCLIPEYPDYDTLESLREFRKNAHEALNLIDHKIAEIAADVPSPEYCPECKTGILKCAPGGGVKCNKCSYWFCY